MTLNANFAGATVMSGRGKLEGPERGLDALIGLVILVAELIIGAMSVFALYLYGTEASPTATDPDALSFGFGVAVFGGGVVVAITTLTYLVRIASGRRSWRAPLWGTILMSVALIIGYTIMASGVSS